MSRNHLIICSIYALLMMAPAMAGQDENTLRPGSWQVSGIATIMGTNWSRVVNLSNNDGKWAIQFTHVSWRYESSTKSTRGPFPITFKDGIITWEEHGKPVSYTYCMDENTLVMPAFIKTDERTWALKSPQHDLLISCQFDPEKTPAGTAEFPPSYFMDQSLSKDAARTQGFYIYEPASASANGKIQPRTLRLMARRPDGLATEDYRLVWEGNKAPSLVPSSTRPPWLFRHDPIDPERLRRIEQLPDAPTAFSRDKSSK